MSSIPKHCCNFAVDTRPVAYWSYDVAVDNDRFLRGVDPLFFSEQVEWLTPQLEGQNRARAAVAVRLLYGHALETFFALLAAAIQAPLCPLGWILSYQPSELRSVVRKLTDDRVEFSRVRRPVTWKTLSDQVNRFTIEDAALDAWVKDGFASAWAQFAWEFLDESFVDEHNSLKHGLRVTQGGFSLRIAPTEPPDGSVDPAPIIDSKSEFGTSFFRRRQLGDRFNCTGDLTGRNWHPTAASVGIELLALSINNVVAFLRLSAGAREGSVSYRWPTAPSNAFEAPFAKEFITASIAQSGIKREEIGVRRPEEILGTYG